MTLSFAGARTHEPDSQCVEYTVFLDGEEIECAIDDGAIASLCDEFVDPLQSFDSCHMLILEYTRRKLCGETTGICARIALRERSYSFLIHGGIYGIEKNEGQSVGKFTE
jgi:hypothetical protein